MSNSISSYSQLKQQILGYDDEEPDPQDEEVVYEQPFDYSAQQTENSQFSLEGSNQQDEYFESQLKGPKRKVVLAPPKRDGRGRPPGSLNLRPGRKRGRKPMVKEVPVRRARRGRPSLYKTVKDLPLIYGSRFSSVDDLTKLLIEYQQIAQIRMNLNESIRLTDTMEYVDRDVLMSLGFSFLSFGCDSAITHCDSDSVEPCPFKLEVVMSQDSNSLFVRLFHDVHCQKVNSPMVEPNDFAELREKISEFGKSYFSRETLQKMNDLRLDGVICDMIFTSKNGGFLKAHKMVAVSRSPVLAQMLLDDEDENEELVKEDADQPCEIKSVRVDCSFETLDDFLNVLYENPISNFHNRNELCSVLLTFEIDANDALKERGQYDSEDEYDPYSAEAYVSDSDVFESSPSPKRRKRTSYGPRARKNHPIYDDFEDSDASLPMEYNNSDFDNQMSQILDSSATEQKKLLVCDICIKPFNDMMSLESHRIIAHKSSQGRASGEKVPFNFSNLGGHKTKMNEEENFENFSGILVDQSQPERLTCTFCSQSFPESGLSRHQQTCSMAYRRNQDCPNCSFKSPSRRTLVEHMLRNHGISLNEREWGSQILRCQEQGCDFMTLHSRQMKKHAEKNHMSRKHLCTVCGKLYATLDTLRVHYYYAHKPCSVLKCKICGKVFRTKQVMDNHVTSHHLLLGPVYQCVYCTQTCTQQRSMRKHLKERHPECEPRFRQTRQPIPFHKGRTTRTGPHSNIYLTKYYSRVYLDSNRDWKRQAKEIEATDLSQAHLVDPDLYTIEEVAVDASCIQDNINDSIDILDAVPVMSDRNTISMADPFQPHFETSMDVGLHERLTSSFTGAYSSPLNIDSIDNNLEPFDGQGPC